MERTLRLLLAAALVTFLLGARATSSRSFNIGGILHSNQSQQHFVQALKKINFDGESVADQTILYDVSVILQGSPITTAIQVCDALVAKSIYSIVVGSPSGGILTTVAISYISSYYQIPAICTHSRDSAFSDKNIHVFFLRTVPPYSHQVDVWIALLKHLNYRQVILIHSSDTNGRSLHSRFQTLAQNTQNDEGIKLTSVIEFSPGEESFVEELNSIREQLVKVILLYADEEDAETIFHDANYLNMTGSGYVWLVTEQALDVRYVPIGALGFQLKHAQDRNAHVTDSLRIVARGLRQLYEQGDNITEPPTNCSDKEGWEETGQLLLKFIKQQVIYDGETGKVAFDSRGDRMFAEYSLINVKEKDSLYFGYNNLQNIGEFSYNKESDEMALFVNTTDIVWPGGGSAIPQGYVLPTHFRVMTLREKPFVYAEPVTTPSECEENDEVLSSHLNSSTNETELMCYWGYCIDLLLTLAHKNNFTFSLELSPDAHYGDLRENAQGKREWSGVIGELVNEENGVDMIAAPLTINPERSAAISFSKPFKYQGITILVKRVPHEAALVSILQPFRDTLWLMLLATVHVIALVVWLLDRLSPVYKVTGAQSDSLTLSESFWFSWGVILNSGLTDGTPKCLSGRVLGIIWGGFAMIMVASYTANLAAFLVLDSPITTITGISDPRLRNPVENFTFATIRGSAVDMFFRRKTEWSNMYRVMEMNNYDTVDEALDALREGTLQAFIWESSRLEYEASQDCNLVTVGELFGRSGYGLGLKKGSPWAEKITIDILDLHERGYMEDLDKTWIWNNEVVCSEDLDQDFSKRLGLKNLEGIFIMVAGGILSGIVLVVAEITYDRCKAKKRQETDGSNGNAPVPIVNGINDTDAIAAGGRQEDSLVNILTTHRIPEADREGTNSMADSRLQDLDASDINSKILLRDIDDRLKSSPNIPEEWKTRTPVQWLEYYSDILNQDADTEVDSPETCRAQSAIEELVKFVQASGIEDFSQLYDNGGNGIKHDDKIVSDDANREEHDGQDNKANAECSTKPLAEKLKLYYNVQAEQKKVSFRQQIEKLPDVLDNCSERGICLSEEEECDCSGCAEGESELGRQYST